MKFPESVIVTGQVVDLSKMTALQKEYCYSLTNEISALYAKSGKERVVVGFSGPSGVGKSVLTGVLRELLYHESLRAEQLGIDAYHETNDELRNRDLLSKKGRYDTYVVEALKKDLSVFRAGNSICFPDYSRTIHEPVTGGGSMWDKNESGLLLVEGLWLLYSGNGWDEVKQLLDVSYYIDEDPAIAQKRTVDRHVRGGRSIRDAESFYNGSDVQNTNLVKQTRAFADYIVKLP